LREINFEAGTGAGRRVDANVAGALVDDAVDGGEAEAGTFAGSLVVKNGSKMRALISGVMPEPLSVTANMT